jgi:DNA invertase Pin-like site-specific DNA recombinase
MRSTEHFGSPNVKKQGSTGRFISYLRVSTDRQGESGLGLEAQREAVLRHLNGGQWELLAEYVEVESGTQTRNRPQLAAALAHAKRSKATLVVARLDRLSRNVAFLAALLESNVPLVCCDFPSADRTMLQMRAVFAEWEARVISERTKAALEAAAARGVRLGNPNLTADNAVRQQAAKAHAETLRGQVEGFKARGLTQRQQVEELNRARVPAARGGSWTLSQWQRVLGRLV